MKQTHIFSIAFFSTLLPGLLILEMNKPWIDSQNPILTDAQLPQVQNGSHTNAFTLDLVQSAAIPVSEYSALTHELEPPIPVTAGTDTNDHDSDLPLIWREHVVRSGENMGEILQKHQLPVQPIIESASDIVNLANIRVGRVIKFGYTQESTKPHIVHYPMGEDDTLVIEHQDDEWFANTLSTQYENKEDVRHMVIQSSLWAAATKANLRPTNIIELSQILEYDVDFNTELHPGDTASVVVEELWKDGEFVKVGNILAIHFQTRHHDYTAVRFENEHGIPEYYDQDGIKREKIFLRSPIAFSQVTSGFNPGRYHPILKTHRPHNGTDFGAPLGTPVRAVASGTITQAAWNGGHGKFVKIDHEDPYETSYSHLSKITVKSGQYVKKGQIIGHVGTTGLSTGPHLHFQMWKNGVFIDSMSADIPTTNKQIPEAQREEFNNKLADILPKLEVQPVALQLD